MKALSLVALVIGASLTGCNAAELSPARSSLDRQEAMASLQQVAPGAGWQAGLSTQVDVTCDGGSDFVVVAREADSVWLGVVPGRLGPASSKPITMRFAIGSARQDSFCASPVRIESYPIECEGDEEKLPGCKPVKGCSGFSVIDDECDSIHVYWDSDQKTLSWWRR